jgi:hypothetical protein
MVAEETLRAYFKGKTIALVGNSQSLFSGKFGEDIDSHDIVCRINLGVVRNRESQGTKTDVLFTSCPQTGRQVREFFEPTPEYVIWATSKGHPRYMEKINGFFRSPVPVWQTLFDNLGSRPSTGIISLNLLAVHFGFEVDMYGFDFFRTKTFYNAQPVNDPHNGDVERRFAHELRGKGQIRIFGDRDDHIDQYRKVHRSNPNYGRSSEKLVGSIRPLVEMVKPKSILDYGCGNSRMLEALGCGKEVELCRYDPAIPKYAMQKYREYDLVICTDVMEHIPADEVLPTIFKIRKLSENVVFSISTVKAHQILPNGENAHCTVHPQEWWLKQIRKCWRKAIVVPQDNPTKFICRTF